jgi:hypothetical protein
MFILILISAIGLWQFSSGVRSVDVVGLFVSGACAGAVVSSFFLVLDRICGF